ncbi:probable cytochrome P450 4s3 isoform X2 [Leptinotarsa decemlineata]|uniref:probable cytochrome P450 4s3 isoform X2 n=1 Tax=Leptinotarsa decemlineata TaxID=7539 RepID=UPI003D30C98E
MFSVVLVLFVILLTVLYSSLCLYRYNTYLSTVPKPSCKLSWILGHTVALFNPRDILQVGVDAAIKYGGVIRVLIPPSVTIAITDNEVIQQFFKDSIVKAGDYAFFKPWLGTGLLTNNGQSWKSRRKLLSQCFGSLGLMKDFIKVFETSGRHFMNELESKIDDENLDIIPIMKKYTLNVLCETAMGVSLSSRGTQGDLYIRNIQNICKVMINRFKLPYERIHWIFYFTNDYRTQQRSIKMVNSFFDDIFEEKLRRVDDEMKIDGKRALLDVLIQFHKSSILTKENIRDEVNTFMFGGYDTTAIALSFALYALAYHPDIQEKIIEEQIEIFGSLNSGIETTYGHLQQMKYLELVILETLRLYPPIPYCGRKVIEETDIGKKFAMLEMKTTLSKIVSNFRISPSKQEFKPQLVPEITLASLNGLRISLEKR